MNKPGVTQGRTPGFSVDNGFSKLTQIQAVTQFCLGLVLKGYP